MWHGAAEVQAPTLWSGRGQTLIARQAVTYRPAFWLWTPGLCTLKPNASSARDTAVSALRSCAVTLAISNAAPAQPNRPITRT